MPFNTLPDNTMRPVSADDNLCRLVSGEMLIYNPFFLLPTTRHPQNVRVIYYGDTMTPRIFGKPTITEPCLFAIAKLWDNNPQGQRLMRDCRLHLQVESGIFIRDVFHNWDTGELGLDYRRLSRGLTVSMCKRRASVYIGSNENLVVSIEGVDPSKVMLSPHTVSALLDPTMRNLLDNSAVFIMTIAETINPEQNA